MSRTTERLIALAAIVLVAIGGYRLSEKQTCEAVNKSYKATDVFLSELVDAFGPLDAENQERVERIEARIQPEDCGWF